MTSSTFVRAVLGAVFVCNAALNGQQSQAPTQSAPRPGPTTPTSPGPTNPGTGSSIPGQQPGQQQPGRMPGQQQPGQFPDMQQRTFFFSGKVMLDDGTPPPEPVQIERVCNGVAKPEAWTDTKGRFSFQLGQNNAMMADASTSGDSGLFGAGGSGMSAPGMPGGRGITERDLIGCELRAALPGFRSDIVSLAGRRSLDNPDIGTVVLHRLAKVDGFTFSATSAFAPKDAKKAYDKGKDLLKKRKLEPAEKEFQKAVSTYPKYAAAWYELGLIYQTEKKLDDAQKAYEQAMKADEKFITPYAQMSRIAAGQKKWDDTVQYTNKVIKLNPFFHPEVYFLNGVANLNLRKLDAAEESAKEALKMDPKNTDPRVLNLLGVIHAQKGEYKLAAEALKKYLALTPNSGDSERVRGQLAELEKEMAKENSGPGKDAQAQ